MNPAWIRALALVCLFAAVVLAAEVVLRRLRWMIFCALDCDVAALVPNDAHKDANSSENQQAGHEKKERVRLHEAPPDK